MDIEQPSSSKKSSSRSRVLMIAEKPSIAKSIAIALSENKFEYRKGKCPFTPIFEYKGDLFDKKAFFVVTSVTGHIYSRDFPEQYNDRRRVDPKDLFGADTIKKEINNEGLILKHLKAEAKGADYLILWLDNDREGENICFEILENVEHLLNKSKKQQVFRAKFSSTAREDIKDAFDKLSEKPNENESMAVEARQIIDLKIGVAFSRFQTNYFRKKYPQVNISLLSYGPCQTPALGFCVNRDDEIKNFEKESFNRIIPKIKIEDQIIPEKKSKKKSAEKQQEIIDENTEFEITWNEDRTYDTSEATKIKKEIEKGKTIKVVEVEEKKSTKGRPEALNTVNLLKQCSQLLEIGPKETMDIAEKLYLNGHITYPRTETTSYPDTFNFNATVGQLGKLQELRPYCKKLQNDINDPKPGKDAKDHPPITPTKRIPYQDKLSTKEWKVYDFISKHFLASISPDAELSKKNVQFETAAGHKFHLNGTNVVSPGFTEITPWAKIPGNIIPEFEEAKSYEIEKVEVKKGKTTAPTHLTESDLMALLEKNGIGTDASMASHINNICQRKYVEIVGKQRKLQPTNLGSALIHGFKKIDEELVAPDLRSDLEASIDKIAKGEAEQQKVIDEVIEKFKQKYENYVEKISLMDEHFQQFFGKFENEFQAALGDKIEKFVKSEESKCSRCSEYLFEEIRFVDKIGDLKKTWYKNICLYCSPEFRSLISGEHKIINTKDPEVLNKRGRKKSTTSSATKSSAKKSTTKEPKSSAKKKPSTTKKSLSKKDPQEEFDKIDKFENKVIEKSKSIKKGSVAKSEGSAAKKRSTKKN